jgi:hypothetical protein
MLLKARLAKTSCCAIFSWPANLLIKLLDMRYLSWASFVCGVWHFPNSVCVQTHTSQHSLWKFPFSFSKFDFCKH